MERKSESKVVAELDARFDALFEAMQTPEAAAAVDRVFTMTPEEMQEAIRKYRDSLPIRK